MASSQVKGGILGYMDHMVRVWFVVGACVIVLGGCMAVRSERVSLVPVAASEPVSTIQLSRAVIATLPNEGGGDVAVGIAMAASRRHIAG
ncbi:hypothetical protein [Achromobacter xylosoxidans]|uniref:hypothetical protein n=1 Tax=Alcaligenes xylosoxydans xylosoxydans TaxID=85698 RepID=UPI000A9A8FF8|nr:hypothetical protein [Achromobacter xylosoxidans]